MEQFINSKNLPEIEREIVSALIFSKDGKILVGQKDPAKGGVYSDCWHIPGGGVDEGETKMDGLRRELREEVNMNVEEAELIDDTGKGATEKTLKDGTVVFCRMNFNVYRVQLNQNSSEIPLKPSGDLIRLMWVDPSELSQIKLTPPSVELFTRLNYLR